MNNKSWERRTSPFNLTRRADSLFVYQAHAFDHFSRRCKNDQGAIPNPPTSRDLACPLCNAVKGFDDFNQDHAPQKAGQSLFGEPACVVLVCKECNHNATLRYEARASRLARGEELYRPDVIVGAALGQDLPGPSSVLKDFDPTNIRDSDEIASGQKSGFLIAFASLGYGFALHQSLDPVRESIRSGSCPELGSGGPIYNLREFLSTAQNLSDKDLPCVVHTDDKVYVLGTSAGWMFGPGLPRNNKSLKREWPTNAIGHAGQITKHLAAGDHFHLDYCTRDHGWGTN